MSERTNSPNCRGNVQPTHCTTLPDKSIYSLSFLVPSASLRHTKPLCPETKAQVKVNKRCLWIFWITNSNCCLHSPCNYLLTDLIPAVKWLAKSMCTQTELESKVVHAIYLLAPSHPWYTAITEPDRKAIQPDLTGDQPHKHNARVLTHKNKQD